MPIKFECITTKRVLPNEAQVMLADVLNQNVEHLEAKDIAVIDIQKISEKKFGLEMVYYSIVLKIIY